MTTQARSSSEGDSPIFASRNIGTVPGRWRHEAVAGAALLIGLAVCTSVSVAQNYSSATDTTSTPVPPPVAGRLGGPSARPQLPRALPAEQRFGAEPQRRTLNVNFASGGAGVELQATGRMPGAELPADLPPETMLEILRASSPSKGNPPAIEVLVALAMQIDPRIVSARAQLEAAKANLDRTRIEVTRQIIEARTRWEVAKRVVEHLDGEVQKNPKDEGLIRRYIDARAQLAQIEADMPLLSASVAAPEMPGVPPLPPIAPEVPGASSSSLRPLPEQRPATAPTDAFGRPSPQQKATSEAIAKALDKPVQVDFNETPLHDVVGYLQDTCGVQFVLDQEDIQARFVAGGVGRVGGSAPEEAKGKGIGDMPVTLHLKGVPLSAVLQAIEDTCDPVRFVVKPYGILVTTAGKARGRGMGEGMF